MLTIAEELYLIALNEKKGKLHFNSSVSLAPALAGALLFDLAINESVVVENKKIRPLDKESELPKLLTDCLQEIKSSKKNRSIKYWVKKFATRKYDVRERVIDELVSRKIIEREEKIYARYLSVHRNWLMNENSKPLVIQKLENAFSSQCFDDSRTASLFITLAASDLEKLIFEKTQVKEVKDCARWLQMDDQIAEAVREIVDELTLFLFVTRSASSAT